MKIGPPPAALTPDANAPAGASAAPARVGADPAASAQRTAAVGGVDHSAEGSAKVELSNTAAALRSSAAGAGGDFDAAKVERMSRAIADGSFKVDPGAIADKLIANAEEVLRSARPAPAG